MLIDVEQINQQSQNNILNNNNFRNALLSPNMRLKLDHFNRDPRVEQAITAHFALAKATWTRSFGYERESSRLVLAKVRAILVEPVSTMPFVLSSIR